MYIINLHFIVIISGLFRVSWHAGATKYSVKGLDMRKRIHTVTHRCGFRQPPPTPPYSKLGCMGCLKRLDAMNAII